MQRRGTALRGLASINGKLRLLCLIAVAVLSCFVLIHYVFFPSSSAASAPASPETRGDEVVEQQGQQISDPNTVPPLSLRTTPKIREQQQQQQQRGKVEKEKRRADMRRKREETEAPPASTSTSTSSPSSTSPLVSGGATDGANDDDESKPTASAAAPLSPSRAPAAEAASASSSASSASGTGDEKIEQRKQQRQHNEKKENLAYADEKSGDGDAALTVDGKICALIIDGRPVALHREPTVEENLQLREIAKATAATLAEFANAKKGKSAGKEQNSVRDGTVYLFSAFADQPELPDGILRGNKEEEERRGGRGGIIKALTFDNEDHRRVNSLKRAGSAAEAAASDETIASGSRGKPTSFVDGVLRIIVAIEKLTKTKKKTEESSNSNDDSPSSPPSCTAGLFVINSVFAIPTQQAGEMRDGPGSRNEQESANANVVDSLRQVIRTMALHPAAATRPDSLFLDASSNNNNNNNNNRHRWVLTPLILSQSSKKQRKDGQKHINVFSFGSDIVELFEGMAWPVPRFYGMPSNFASVEQNTVTDSPSGVFAYFTPSAVEVLPDVIREFADTPRSRLSHALIEQVRNPPHLSATGGNNNSNDNSSNNNNNTVRSVDIRLSEHHLFEVHLLACDAALAELAGWGVAAARRTSSSSAAPAGGAAVQQDGSRIIAPGFLTLAVRDNVIPPLVFEEESVSARYMIAAAHAATGLGSVHLHDNKNLTKALLAAGYGGTGDPLSKDLAEKLLQIHDENSKKNQPEQQELQQQHEHHLQLRPSTLVRAPVPWVAQVLPYVSAVASEAWQRFVAERTAVPNMTLFWDPYCGCSGINVEAINFLVPLERRVRIRAVADPKCWCRGFPATDQFALKRMSGPKLLAGGSTSRFHVWVSHKPVDAFPEFPYDGAIQYGIYPPAVSSPSSSSGTQHRHLRPDYIIGRTMIESDRIPQDWVSRLNADPCPVDELWVPSRFLLDAFRNSGVRASLPITVIPEAIDTNFYNPGTTKSDFPNFEDRATIGCQMPYTECVVFLSNFKWERRKGWDVLLRAYFSAFTDRDNVVLVLKTWLYLDSDPYNVDKIRNKIFSFVREQMPEKNLRFLPKIWVLSGDGGSGGNGGDKETPAVFMPKLYKAADVFVLPSRGEGWGLPLMEAMAMGLVTIGTGWSGMLDFMPRHRDRVTHFLVNMTGLETAEGRGASKQEANDPSRKTPLFAAPSAEHLQELLVHTAKVMSRQERVAMGQQARFEIGQHLSRAPVSEMVMKRLAEIYKETHAKR